MAELSDAGFPYHRVAADLRNAISDGRLNPGERLSSEWDLAAHYSTSRPTVRRAIALLKGEGLILTEQGRGTFVRPNPPVRLTVTAANFHRHREAGVPGFNAQVIDQNQRPRQVLVDVREGGAPAEIAERLQLPEGAAVLTRTRLFLVDDEPVAICISHYEAELVRGTPIAHSRLIAGGALRIIEDRAGPIGRTVRRSTDDLTARMPTPSERADLRLHSGMPVVRVLRTMYDTEDRVVEVQDTVAAAARHCFRYEVDL